MPREVISLLNLPSSSRCRRNIHPTVFRDIARARRKCIFFTGSPPYRVVPLFIPVSLVATKRREEEEKPTEFANGSLLRNDTAEFSRGIAARISFPGPAPPLFPSSSRLPVQPSRPSSSFPKFCHPETRTVHFIPSLSTLLFFVSFTVLSLSLSPRIRTFRVCRSLKGIFKDPSFLFLYMA